MNRIIYSLVILLFSSNLFANVYLCSGNTYQMEIFNRDQIPANANAMILLNKKTGHQFSVISANAEARASFDIEFFGRTGDAVVKYISIAIKDGGITSGQSASANISLDTNTGRISERMTCVRGNDSFPSM